MQKQGEIVLMVQALFIREIILWKLTNLFMQHVRMHKVHCASRQKLKLSAE